MLPKLLYAILGLLQVLLNVLADEIHRAHQRCSQEGVACDPANRKMELVFEAGVNTMKLLKGAYSCISMIAGVGLVAFRDPFGIRYTPSATDGDPGTIHHILSMRHLLCQTCSGQV